MGAEEQIDETIVSWSYRDHPARWFVALVAAFNIVLSAADAHNSGVPVDGALTFEFSLRIVGMFFGLFVIGVCVLPKVDGTFIRRGMHFEIDFGRRTFDLLGGFSEFLSIFGAKEGIAKVDIGDMNRRVMNRFFPRRIKYSGDLGAILSVSPTTSALGPALAIGNSLGWEAKVDDLPAGGIEHLLNKLTKIAKTEAASSS